MLLKVPLSYVGAMASGLFVGMAVREWARAWATVRLGDPTPRLWGKLTPAPRAWFDPFGSALLPGLVLTLWALASGFLPPPVAYGKPAALDPTRLRSRRRSISLLSLAGPLADLLLGLAAAGVARVSTDDVRIVATGFAFSCLCLAVFHLVPLPGLDGARIVALVLPPRAAEVYRNLDQYLPLFVLVVLFILSGPVWSMVYAIADAAFRVGAGFPLPFV
jgi:Zn-dependent protease